MLDELIIELKFHSDFEIRRYVPDKLAKLGDWRSTTPLGEILIAANENLLLRNECAEALGKQGDPLSIFYLRRALKDEDPELRRTSIWALGQIGSPDTLPILVEQKNDPSDRVRRWIIKSLNRIINVDRHIILKTFYQNYGFKNDKEKIVADILRGITNEIKVLTFGDIEFWSKEWYSYLSGNYTPLIKRTSIVLLNNLFDQGHQPRFNKILNLYKATKDQVLKNELLLSLAYSKKIANVKIDQIDSWYIRALSIGGEIELLKKLSENAELLSDKAFDDLIDSYIKHKIQFDYTEASNLSLSKRLSLLRFELSVNFNESLFLEFWNRGKGKNYLIDIVFSNSQLMSTYLIPTLTEGNKQIKKTIVNHFLEFGIPKILNMRNLEKIVMKEILENRIWHLRRDLRHLLYIINFQIF